jgi:phage protein D
MTTIRRPVFNIFYNGKNITADLSLYVLSVRYTDKVIGESDDLEIQLEDTDRRWIDTWYPTKGDRLKLQMGYAGSVLDCGEFEIDEITLDGPPDTVTLKAIATWVTSPMRTNDSKGHENKTLKEIAEYVAKKNDLTLLGDIQTIRIARSTQNREPDIAYLHRIASEFGYAFSIRGKQLIFTSIYELEDGVAVKVINKSDMTSYSITDKTSETYSSAVVKYQDPATKSVNSYEVKQEANKDGVVFNKVVKKDVLIIKDKAENKQQAESKAKAALHSKNSMQQVLSFSIFGDPLLVAGNNIDVTGFGQLSGRYHITQSTHNDSKSSGYTTECECKRVAEGEKSKQKITEEKEVAPVEYENKTETNADGVTFTKVLEK